MNLEEYRKRIGEMADELAAADGAADRAGTLERAAMMAEMYQSDDWLELARDLVKLPTNTGSPYKRRERTRPRFAKFNAALAETDGHRALAVGQTIRLLNAADALPFLKNHSLGANFRTEHSVRPLSKLVLSGYGDLIPDAIDKATEDGAPLTAKTLTHAVAEVKKKADDQRRGVTYRAGANERTESAEYRAEKAFLALLKTARNSANGVEQVNRYIQFIKDETRKYRREDAA